MVQYYSIAGKKIGSHYLAMLTLGTIGGLAVAFSGGSAAKKTQGPPINASSPGEESFIKDFLKSAEEDAKKGAETVKKAAH